MNALDKMKAPLVEFISQNLPVSYERQEADSYWGISIDEEGNMVLEGYAQEIIANDDWRQLPLSELAYLVENIN